MPEELTEAENDLRLKYEDVQHQLEEAGLETWEIVAELGEVALWEQDSEGISFYLSDDGEILYSYASKDFEEADSLDSRISIGSTIPSNVQEIIDAVSRNPYLTEEEKSAILELNLGKWIAHSEDLQTEELVWRYENLVIEYDYKPDGFLSYNEFNPHERADGSYSSRAYDKDRGVYNFITLYNGNSLEESLEASREVLEHESNHTNGQFGNNISMLLNEGYNTLLTCPDSKRYENEVYMAALVTETFGEETMSRAYYRMDIDTELVNAIVEKTGRNRDEVEIEVAGFLEDIEEVLYKMGELEDDYTQNQELMDKLEKLFGKLEIYHEIIQGRKIEENTIAEILKMKLRQRDDRGLLKENENLYINGYYLSTGKLDATIVASEGELKYEVGTKEYQSPSPVYSRNIVLGNSNKYGDPVKIIRNVKDSQIDYLSFD